MQLPARPGIVATNPNNPALVNLTQGQIPAYRDTIGKAVAGYVGSKQEGLSGAQDMVRAAQEIQRHLFDENGNPRTATGPGAQTLAEASSFMQNFGVDLNKVLPSGWQTDPTIANIVQKNVNQLTAAFAKSEFPQRITNSDLTLAGASVPGFWARPDAIKTLTQNLVDIGNMKIEEAKFLRNYDKSLPSDQVPGWDIIDAWQSHLAKLPGIPSELKQAYLAQNAMGQPVAETPPAPTADASKKSQYTPDQIRAEIARRGLKP
jgi:hypothetical protein